MCSRSDWSFLDPQLGIDISLRRVFALCLDEKPKYTQMFAFSKPFLILVPSKICRQIISYSVKCQ